jgi:hypothetical protein
LERSLTRLGFLGGFHGHVYGTVSEDRFELWTPGNARGHVARVIGRIDMSAKPTSGSLRFVPDPMIGLVWLVLIVVVAVASQFLATTWVRIGLPVVGLLGIVVVVWQARVEYRLLMRHLRDVAQVELGDSRL